jgi:outer membrane protein
LGAAIGRPVPATTSLTDVVSAPGGASLLSPPPAPTPGAGAPTPPPIPALAPPPALDESIVAAVRGRPELLQVAAQVRAAGYLEAAARAGKLPLLTGVGSVGKINPVPLFESSDNPYAVGIALSIPIFTGGLVEGQVEEARRNAAAARANLEELTNQIRQQVISALSNLSTSQANLRVAQAQRVQAADALSLATQRYQARLGSIVELTQAQVNDAAAENDFIQALYDQELARAALEYAVGRSSYGAARSADSVSGKDRSPNTEHEIRTTHQGAGK